MRVRRDVSSIPFRSASDTWAQIIDLVTGPDSRDVQQITGAAGVMGSIITDEHLATRALIIEGVGPQLLVYCRHGMKAMEEGGDIDSLTWNPTAGDWTMRVPCDSENIAWVRAALTASSPRIKVFDMSEPETDERFDEADGKANAVVVDWNVKGLS
ncbi:MAG: hypothetical protein QOD75_2044 [Blastocatellia bacterium]|nr:hypothetical protein [Blastocatellia bacterium]